PALPQMKTRSVDSPRTSRPARPVERGPKEASMRTASRISRVLVALLLLLLATPRIWAPEPPTSGAPRGVEPEDAYLLRVVNGLEISAAESLLAYTVEQADLEANRYRSALWTMSADGANPRELSRKGWDDRHPRFSPDGKRLAFLSDRGEEAQIYVVP